jgi:hypothetical protein
LHASPKINKNHILLFFILFKILGCYRYHHAGAGMHHQHKREFVGLLVEVVLGWNWTKTRPGK